MEFEITVKGRKHLASRERVIEALDGVAPEPETLWMVEVEGAWYPVKQAFCETFGVERKDASTTDARRVLERLGLKVMRADVPIRKRAPGEEALRRRRPPLIRWDRQERLPPEVLSIPDIWIKWSFVESFDDIAGTGEHSEEIDLPPPEPGVYEVRCRGRYEPLYIGRTLNLRQRVRDALVKGIAVHVAGQRMRENEGPALLCVRWAVTDRPAAAEEELLRRHEKFWGHLPEYVGHV
jgi:hypothetical protein